METCFNWTDTNVCYASSDQRHWIAVIRRVAKEHPDEVTVLAEPETNDGCIYVKMPTSYIHVYAPRKNAEVSEERRAELAANMGRVRSALKRGDQK